MTRDRWRRRGVLAAAGTGVAALAGCLTGSPTSTPTGEEGVVASAPLPSDPSSTYARMGEDGASATATYYGNWKCPYCAQFSRGFLSTLVTDYVEPGDLQVEFRGMAYIGGDPFLGADAPRATRAGLAVWNAEPESYWAFHEHVMRNQPPENKLWATTDKLVSFAEAAGVSDTDAIRSAILEGSYESAIRATSQDAAAAGIQGTPAMVVGGTVVNPLDQGPTRQAIEDAI